MKRIIAGLALLALLLPLLASAVRAEAPAYPGKAYCLMDAETGTILLAHNEHERLAPASVTKIMTLLLIMEAVDSGQLDWKDSVTASETAAAKGGSQIYLKVGETMSVEELVKSIAVSSANDSACAMAEALCGSEAAFVERMNEKARELSMEDTHFVNCTGLDDSPEAREHRTSAHDIAQMSRELLVGHPQIKRFTTIWMDSVRNGSFGLSNTNKLVRFYPGCTGLKTGYTSGAGFCLSASALREDLELIAVVLGCESSKERFAACRSMLDFGFAGFARYEAQLPPLSPIPVTLGETDQALPQLKAPCRLLVEKSRLPRLETELTLLPQLCAPLSKGAEVGYVRIFEGAETLLRMPLVLPEDIPRMSRGALFSMLLRQLALGA